MSANHCARKPWEPTDRQREVLDTMFRHKVEHDEWPPMRWLMAQLGIQSTNAMRDHLCALVRKGLAEQRLGKGRAYHVTAKGRRFLSFSWLPRADGRSPLEPRRSAAPESKAGSQAVNNAGVGEGS